MSALADPPALASRMERVRGSEIRDLLHIIEQPQVLSLAGGLPAAASLPVEQVRSAIDVALGRTGANGATALQYGPTEGLADLRDAVAPGTPGSPALGDPENVLVTSGAQQGLDLVVRALIDPGDPVVVEDPLYLGTRQVLDAHGAYLVPLPVDRDGLDPDTLAAALDAGLRPKAVVCVPNFSNPTGASLPTGRRIALAALAQRYGFVIIEDDAYHGLGFSGPPPPPIRMYAPDHVVTIASASKMLAPGLRLGFVGAPPWLASSLALVKQSVDLHTATLTQLVALELIRDQRFLRLHLASVSARNAERAAILRAALAGAVETSMPDGGMFLWGTTAVDTRAAFPAAIAAGVAYVPGDAFTVARDGRVDLRLSFATLEPTALRTAAQRLRTVLVDAVA